MASTVKHATASVFLFNRQPDSQFLIRPPRIGLIFHRRLQRWMIPGGHVEADENAAEAGLREVQEETGYQARLLKTGSLAYPGQAPDVAVPLPLWIVEQEVPPERREPRAHIHVDHMYLAVAETGRASMAAELRFGWYNEADLRGLHMFDGTRACAFELFRRFEAHEA